MPMHFTAELGETAMQALERIMLFLLLLLASGAGQAILIETRSRRRERGATPNASHFWP